MRHPALIRSHPTLKRNCVGVRLVRYATVSRLCGKKVKMPIFDIHISPDEPVYVISVVSKLTELPVWTLRQLDKAGIVCPKRIGKKSRLYSLKDIRRLEYVHYLLEDRQVNIRGVKMILELELKE